MATERYDIIINERGAREASRDISQIGTAADTAADGVGLLKSALAGLTVAAALRAMLQLTETFTELQNKLMVTTGSLGSATQAFNRLLDISNKTRSPLESNVQLFQRLSMAAGELGASQNQLYQFVENIGTALAIQGGSAEQARGALLQLSQAMGAGIVRAEEYNSIIEGAYPIALAAAKGLDAAGGSVAKLTQLVKSGQVTSKQFFDAILSQSAELSEQFARTTPTIAQAWTVLRNNAIAYVGQADQALGVTKSISLAMIDLAANLDKVATSLVIVAGAAAVLAGPTALMAVYRVLQAIVALVLRNPFTLLVTAIASALVYLTSFSNTLSDIEKSLSFHIGIVERLKALWAGVVAYIKAAWASFPEWLAGIATRALNRVIVTVVEGLNSIGDALDSIFGKEGTGRLDIAEYVIPEVGRFADAGDAAATAFSDAYKKSLIESNAANLTASVGDPNAPLGPGGNPLGDKNKDRYTFETVKRDLERQITLLNMETQARERLAQAYDIQDRLKRNLTTKEAQYLDQELRYIQALTDQREILDTMQAPFENYARKVSALVELLDQGRITSEAYMEQTRQLRIELLELDKTITGGLVRGALKLQEEFTNLSTLAESTLTNAFRGAEDAMVSFVTTGKASFSDLVSSILADLARLAIRQSITGPLANIVGTFLGGLATSPSSGVTMPTGGLKVPASMGGPRALGGPASAGSMYPVLERGPEILSTGGRDYLMMGSESGRVTPLRQGGGGGSQPVIVQLQPQIYNNASDKVAVRTEEGTDDQGQPSFRVMIDAIENELSGRVDSGRGKLLGSMGRALGVQPKPRGG